jgi:hypothetical protein
MTAQLASQEPARLDRGRFTVAYYPQDRLLATSLAQRAIATDTFPGLPRPTQHVLIAIAPDKARFREWAGAGAPEWGAALAFPESHRIILQGSSAGSDAGDPVFVLRHELAHLALHEQLGDLPPRWFDEGFATYAAGEWGRDEVLRANLALALRGMPTLDELEDDFTHGESAAQYAYALAYRAVADLAAIDREHGLALFFQYWRASGSLDRAVRQAYGITLADFEQHWRANTRRQYGGLALLSNVAIAGVLLLVILLPLYIVRRRRDRLRLEQMRRADDAAERMAQASAIAELLGESSDPSA